MDLFSWAAAAVLLLVPLPFLPRKEFAKWAQKAASMQAQSLYLLFASAFVLLSALFSSLSHVSLPQAGLEELPFLLLLAIGEELFYRFLVQRNLGAGPAVLLYSLLMPLAFAQGFSRYLLLAFLFFIRAAMATFLSSRFSVFSSICFRLATLVASLAFNASPQAVIEIALLSLPIAFALVVEKKQKEDFGLKFDDLRQQLTRGVVLFLLVLALIFIEANLLSLVHFADSAKVATALGKQNLFGLAVVVFLAPVAEELFFRGFLQKRFGVILASLIFAALHYGFGSVLEIVAALTFALVAGDYVRKNKLLLPAIVAHLLFNAYGVAVVLLQGAR